MPSGKKQILHINSMVCFQIFYLNRIIIFCDFGSLPEYLFLKYIFVYILYSCTLIQNLKQLLSKSVYFKAMQITTFKFPNQRNNQIFTWCKLVLFSAALLFTPAHYLSLYIFI